MSNIKNRIKQLESKSVTEAATAPVALRPQISKEAWLAAHSWAFENHVVVTLDFLESFENKNVV